MFYLFRVSRLFFAVLPLLLLLGCSESPQPSESVATAQDDSAIEHARKHLDPKYVCPMHAQIVRDEPGNCPICGMDLVAREIERGQLQGPEVSVSTGIGQAMNLRTAPVERRTLWRYIKTLGRVGYDETRLYHLHPRASGWVEHLALRAEGDPVKKDQLLVQLYSPEILDAQVDYLIALQGKQDTLRHTKAENRLRLFDVPDDVIAGIAARGETQRQVPIRALQDGIVTKLNIREGMYVKPEMELMTLADLAKVWVWVDVYEHQLAWIKPGLSAEIRAPAIPGQLWEGKVEYVYPELDPKTRTLRVRISVQNPEGLLKPNLFTDVVIFGGPKRDVVAIRKEALILDADRQVVIKQVGEGRFSPVKVVPGMRTAEHVEILSGLKVGDEIVVSGQFLIDSEANIQASFARMADGGDDKEPPPIKTHKSMDH